MNELQSVVESLLNDSVDSSSTEDLNTILKLLKDDEATTNATTTPDKSPASNLGAPTQSLRQKLGNNIDHLKDCLCEYMAERVCLDDLLPMTYDEDANEDAMGDHNALTLTNSSLLAAQVYARLLAFPASFSSGLVDLHVLSELPRILTRWRTECNGREWALVSEQKHGAPLISAKNMQSTKRARRFDTTDDESSADDDDNSDSSRNDDDSSAYISQTNENVLTERQLIVRGLELALLVAKLPTFKHFASWNKDCRSTIFNAVGSSLATTAALFLQGKRQSKQVDAGLEKMASNVIAAASLAMGDCLTKVADSSLTTDVALEMVVDVQRNLYSLITLSASDLPNGEEGQNTAGQVASDVFKRLVVHAVNYALDAPGERARSAAVNRSIVKTPRSGRRDAADDENPNTPMSNRKKRAEQRQSIGSSPTPITLKKRSSICTPGTGERRASFAADALKCSLHPVLQRVASMMQRLLTDPLNVTSKVRASTCAAVESCLVGSRHSGMIEFVLCWVVKILDSNADFHRLAAIRLASFALVHDSICDNLRMKWDGGDYCNEDIATVLFAGLRKRVSDLKQPVRVAAANEFTAMFESLHKERHATLLRTFRAEAEDVADLFRSLILEESSANGKICFIKGLVALLGVGEQLTIVVTQDDIKVLVLTCQDAKSLMLRAAAAEGLTTLLDYQLADDVYEGALNQWSLAVLPMVLDSELRVQTKALQLVDQTILDPVVGLNNSITSRRAWSILSAISCRTTQPGGSKLEADALRFAISQRNDIVKLFICIQREGAAMVEDINSNASAAGLWCLFHAVMEHKSNIKDVASLIKRNARLHGHFDFAVASFFSLFITCHVDPDSESCVSAKVHCLEVLPMLAFCLDDGGMFLRLSVHLDKLLATFQLETVYIAAAVQLYFASLMCSSRAPEPTAMVCTEAIRRLFANCEKEIFERVDVNGFSAQNELLLSRVMCTLGEVRLIGYVSDDTCGKIDVTTLISSLHLDVKPSDKLHKAVMAFSSRKTFGELIRGHALAALGKMCLRDEGLAKESLSVFVQALQCQESPAIRSNALLCMGDMIVRYTNLADRFLPEMASCLQAGISSGDGQRHVLTRKHAILVLAELLLQDFIKWRGSLFPSFLLATIDEDEDVASLAESMICGPLKKDKLFASHFVESMFVLNGCEAHDMLKTFESLSDLAPGTTFCSDHLLGCKGFAQRQKLYELMISQLTEAEKIAVTAGIAKDILTRCTQQGSGLSQACATDNADDPGYNVLLDALTILASKTIRPRRTPKDAEIESISKNEALRLKVKGALIHKVSRKHLLEHMLPMLVQIREALKRHRSPLVPTLMEYFVVVFRLFPDEVRDNLTLKHPVLLQEIQFDAKHRHTNQIFADSSLSLV
ncbi:hypothetical protein MPSEU_000491700 [Mayamaea pseudoterrestris]|nr:hypothetical protein MPSEU_000491700 [Mayamaea pseudoterrestris]